MVAPQCTYYMKIKITFWLRRNNTYSPTNKHCVHWVNAVILVSY